MILIEEFTDSNSVLVVLICYLHFTFALLFTQTRCKLKSANILHMMGESDVEAEMKNSLINHWQIPDVILFKYSCMTQTKMHVLFSMFAPEPEPKPTLPPFLNQIFIGGEMDNELLSVYKKKTLLNLC